MAATKSMIASLVAGASLVAHWSEDGELLAALARLPSILDSVVRRAARGGGDRDAGQSLVPVRRRPRRDPRCRRRGGAQAQGNLGDSRRGLLFRRSAAWAGRDHRARDFRSSPSRPPDAARRGFSTPSTASPRSARRRSSSTCEPHARWPTVVALDGGHPLLTPIVALHAFYRVAEATARRRGRDPDQPPHLRKVTETL